MADLSQLTLNAIEMIQMYQEINGNDIDHLTQQPTALRFLKYVARSRPFVLSGGCSAFPAVDKWDFEYLSNVFGSAEIETAQTPHGNADSVVSNGDGTIQFAMPFQRRMPFNEFMSSLRREKPDAPVNYLQAQNDNLRQKHPKLFADGDEALGPENLDAVNLWLGSRDSVTALHRDNYENIYCQIIGQKHFRLLPPIAAAGVNEQWLRESTYDKNLKLSLDDTESRIPCAIWDPDTPNSNATPVSLVCEPLRVTLNPGDMLYLPACWYHKVSQSNSTEGINCSVNYWYDQDYSSTLYAASEFVRRTAWSTK